LGIDETALCIPSTERGSFVVPEEIAPAFVDVVGKAAEIESTGMEAV